MTTKRIIFEVNPKEFGLTHRGGLTKPQKAVQEDAAYRLSERLYKTSMVAIVVTTTGNHGYPPATWETQDQCHV